MKLVFNYYVSVKAFSGCSDLLQIAEPNIIIQSIDKEKVLQGRRVNS